MTKPVEIIYGGKRPLGWVLAHNNVRADVNTKHGERGFRRFWVQPGEKWKPCSCGSARLFSDAAKNAAKMTRVETKHPQSD